jgi:hypothetical protein
MKRWPLSLVVCALLLSFASPQLAGAAKPKPKAIPTIVAPTEAEATDGDADVPPMARGKIDKATYNRLRDEYFLSLRGIDPDKPFNPLLRTQAVTKMQSQNRIEGTNWVPLGPAPIPNGQTQQFPTTAATTGRATAIVVDPTNPSRVYMGTAQGGVWRSLDAGLTWTAIFDSAQSLAVGALALAPSDTTKLYVGTGEPNNSGDSFFGVGVYRIDSVDTAPALVGPINPSLTTGTAPAITTNIFTGRAISKILVHPTDPATIFVSTAAGVSGASGSSLSNLVPPLGLRGVYRSTNATAAAGSVVFQKLIVNTDGSLDGTPATGNTSIFDMVMDPGDANTIFVTTSGTTLGGQIFRSVNALAATPTFTSVLAPGFNGLVMRLAIQGTGATATLYMGSNEPSGTPACSAAGNAGRVRKSIDGGTTWSLPLAAAEGYCGGQCVYDNPVGVDPTNANIVYIGGNARGTCSDLLKRSPDGGTTFVRDDTGLHADSHAFAFDTSTTPTTVYFVTDGGVWKRQDAAPATPWTDLNTLGLSTVQFVSVAVHPIDSILTIGGTQDNGTEAQTPTSGTWVSAESGDGGYALIDRSSPNITTDTTMYHTFFNQRNNLIGFDRTNFGTCLASKDSWEFRGNAAFAFVDPTPSCDGTAFGAANGISLTDFVIFYAPMALGPGTPNTFYFGTDRLYRSTDKGDTMTAVSQTPIVTVPANTAITTIGIAASNDNVRVVGMRSGQIFGTVSGANPLINLTNTPGPNPFPPVNANASTTNRFVGRAVIDPVTMTTAYVTFSYYTNFPNQQIWKTTTLSDTPGTTQWVASGTGIPNVPVNALVISPVDSNYLWAGTDIGVYASTDAGATWAPFGTGLPIVAVMDLAIQPVTRTLRAATHGRGMWEVSDIQLGVTLQSIEVE